MSKFLTSSNPLMGEKAIEKTQNSQELHHEGTLSIEERESMTVSGSINKTFLLTGLMLCTAVIGYMNPNIVNVLVGAIGGLIAVIFISFRPKSGYIAGPIYALLEGLFVGSVSAMYASLMNGIILQAVLLTILTLLIMLVIYKSGLIKVTNKFRTGVMMATGAIMLVYLASFALSFFGIQIPYLHEGGWMGIGISLLIIGVAALNLLLDFDFIEKGDERGLPKYYEWLGAVGLLVTLVWLYIEILRLLSIVNRD